MHLHVPYEPRPWRKHSTLALQPHCYRCLFQRMPFSNYVRMHTHSVVPRSQIVDIHLRTGLATCIYTCSKYIWYNIYLWSGNDTMCVHTHIARKWHLLKQAAVAVCFEWHMTSVNFKLWRRYVLLDLCANQDRGTHCICAKATVSTWTILELAWLNKIVIMTKTALVATAHCCA